MLSAHGSPRLSIGGPTLVIGPDGDVELIDVSGLSPAEATSAVTQAVSDAAPGQAVGLGWTGVQGATAGPSGADALLAGLGAGASLALLEVAGLELDTIAAVVRSGVVVVLRADDPLVALAAVDSLSQVVDTARVVIEVGPSPEVVEQATLLEHAAYGCRIGADLSIPDAFAGAGAEGWQIGALSALLELPVATVRGVGGRRVRRVHTILDAIEEGAAPT